VATERTPPPLAMARTEFVPAGGRGGDATPPPMATASGEIKPLGQPSAPSAQATASGTAQAAPKAKGGIPWGDSPKMPAQFTPMPIVQAPPPSSGGYGGGGGGGGSSPAVARGSVSNGGGTPAIGNAIPGFSAPAVSAPPPSAEVICSSCGKPIAPGFAFCGTCGARVAPAAAPVAPAANPRTMFMGGPAAANAPATRGRLILIRPDGSEGGVHTLYDGENIIGRGQGPLFDNDAYLSPRHGEFLVGPAGMVIRDLRSLNGVFLKITQEEPLESGDIFRIGQELLRFEIISSPQPLEDGTEIMGTPNPGFWGRLSVVVGRDVDGSAFPLFGDAIVLGRERGDVLFPEDGYVSGSHAKIAINDSQVFLSDLGSSNGTFLRIRSERQVPSGSFVLMGQQLFRVELS
jgi:pSer/pThr/pTyr-binding forkhead associated (FHA) protein